MVWRLQDYSNTSWKKSFQGGCMCWKEKTSFGGPASAHRFKAEVTQSTEKPKVVNEDKQGTGMGVSRTTNQRKKILEEIGDMLTGSSKK